MRKEAILIGIFLFILISNVSATSEINHCFGNGTFNTTFSQPPNTHFIIEYPLNSDDIFNSIVIQTFNMHPIIWTSHNFNYTPYEIGGSISINYKNKSYFGMLSDGLVFFEFKGDNASVLKDFLSSGKIKTNSYLISDDGSYIILTQTDIISYQNEIYEFCFRGIVNEDHNKVVLLESWKQSVSILIDEITIKIAELFGAVEDIDNRLPDINETLKNYFKYLSSSDRKNMVCGFAEENHLEHIEDLGFSCDLIYRTLRSGKESVNCKCRKI